MWVMSRPARKRYDDTIVSIVSVVFSLEQQRLPYPISRTRMGFSPRNMTARP